MTKINSRKTVEGRVFVCQKITEIPKDAYRYSRKWRGFGHMSHVEIIAATKAQKAKYCVWVCNRSDHSVS